MEPNRCNCLYLKAFRSRENVRNRVRKRYDCTDVEKSKPMSLGGSWALQRVEGCQGRAGRDPKLNPHMLVFSLPVASPSSVRSRSCQLRACAWFSPPRCPSKTAGWVGVVLPHLYFIGRPLSRSIWENPPKSPSLFGDESWNAGLCLFIVRLS